MRPVQSDYSMAAAFWTIARGWCSMLYHSPIGGAGTMSVADLHELAARLHKAEEAARESGAKPADLRYWRRPSYKRCTS